jgi:GPH family glycoside/pentoside/hexuronide:cation symporter
MNLSPIKKVVYALGQFGLVLCAFGAGSLFVGFFVDRTFSTEIQFPAFIYQNYLFGIFTVAGLILALNKLIEAGAGLFFGWASDRNRMKKGRRSGFMLIAVFPVSVFSVLLFFPPFAHALVANSVFVLVCTVLFYFSLSLYASPYLALLSEFGKTSRDRLVLSTLLACATALASLLGNRIFYFMENLQAASGLTALSAFRVILAGYAIVAGICMLLPVLLMTRKGCVLRRRFRIPFPLP